jgi:hypothetical protein
MFFGKSKEEKKYTRKRMRIALKSICAAGIIVFLGGCTDIASADRQYAYDINKRHIVQYGEDNYYYRPDNSWSQRLNANEANLNNVASSGKLHCRENDIWFISMNDREKEGKIRYRYMISLAKSQLMKMENNATYIPRRDSKEFKDLIKIDTQMAHQSLIGCSSRISKKEIAKIGISLPPVVPINN